MSSRLHGLQRFWQLGAAVCLGAFVAVAEDASVAIRSVTHWAFQPLAKPAVPSIRNSEWPKTLLDRFILARLEDAGMQSSPPTDKRTLLRRATFNLIGLPPTPQEIAAFEADGSPHAFDAVIDFDKELRDPEHPLRMLPIYDNGDHLHPSDVGYNHMGDIIDLALFD